MDLICLDADYLLVVRGNMKKEELLIGGERFDFAPGVVISHLLNLDKSVLQTIFDGANFLLKTTKEEREYWLKRKNLQGGEAAFEVLQGIARKILSLRLPMFLKRIFLFLPAQGPYLNTVRYTNQKCISETQRQDDWEYDRGRGKIAEFQKDTDEHTVEWLCWMAWLHALSTGSEESGFWDQIKLHYDSFKIYEIIIEYCDNLRTICIEIEKLQRDLPCLIGIAKHAYFSKEDVKNDVISWTSRARTLWSEEEQKIFGATIVNGEPAVAIDTISALVKYELNLRDRYFLAFKSCEYCDKLFATHNPCKKYCNYPNIDHGEKRCNEIAAQDTYTRKMKASSVREIRHSSRLSYKQWVRRINKSGEVQKCIDTCKFHRNVERSSVDRIRCLLIEKIELEINATYEQWKKTTQKAIKDFEESRISEEECLTAVKLPNIKDRSPLLTYIKDAGYCLAKDDLKMIGIV